MPRRRAVAISPVVVVLALLLISVVAWKFWYQRDLIPDAYPGAAKVRSKIFWSNANTIIISAIVATGLGAAAYFIFRRSDKAANLASGTCLAIPVALLTMQAYRTMTGTRPQTEALSALVAPMSPPQTPNPPPPPFLYNAPIPRRPRDVRMDAGKPFLQRSETPWPTKPTPSSVPTRTSRGT